MCLSLLLWDWEAASFLCSSSEFLTHLFLQFVLLHPACTLARLSSSLCGLSLCSSVVCGALSLCSTSHVLFPDYAPHNMCSQAGLLYSLCCLQPALQEPVFAKSVLPKLTPPSLCSGHVRALCRSMRPSSSCSSHPCSLSLCTSWLMFPSVCSPFP